MKKTILSYLLIFTSIAHVPLIYIQEDSIGLFDFFIAILFIRLIFIKINNKPKYSNLLFIYIIYISYIIFSIITIGSKSLESVALLLKHIQFSIIYVTSLYTFKDIKLHNIILIILISTLTITINGSLKLFYYNEWYRLGLPGMLGVSSNPAGFAIGLTTITIFYIIIKNKNDKYNTILTLIFALNIGALYFTYSKTNQLTMILTLIVIITLNIKELNKKYVKIIMLIGVIIIGISYLSISSLNTKGAENVISELFDTEEYILNDQSYIKRTIAWQSKFDAYTSSNLSMMFGIGFGKVTAIDSLYFRIIYELGIIGAIILVMLIYYLMQPIKIDSITTYMLIFILINGIAGETLYSSYRSVQYFLVLLAAVQIIYKRWIKYT